MVEAVKEDAFPGYTTFIRPLSELETMLEGWKVALQAVRGVYLLTCPTTGDWYVEMASGEEGFLGRWRDYMANNAPGSDPTDQDVANYSPGLDATDIGKLGKS